VPYAARKFPQIPGRLSPLPPGEYPARWVASRDSGRGPV
jgi:hypothetical protein